MLGLEDTMDHMLWMGESLMNLGKVRTLSDIIRIVKSIKREDIKCLSKQILDEKKYSLAIVGPVTDSQKRELCKLIGAEFC